MAGPGGRPVGRVSVTVLPDTSKFAQSLERYLDRVEKRLQVELPVSLSKPDVARTEAELAALSRDRKVKLDVDTSGIDRISKSFDKVGGGGRGGFGLLNPALLGSVVAAVGVLGAALPGLLAAVAGPLGAIAVGFEGIKKAAAGLAEPFKALRTTVAAAFEQGLTPVFKNLEKIFPVLEDGAVRMADAMTLMADVVVDKLTSPEGLAMLESIFTNIADALTDLAPAMGPFVDSLLTLAESGTAAFAEFAPLIAKLIEDFNKFLVWAEESGVLEAAMEAIGFAIYAVIGFFGGLVAAAIVAAAILRAFVKGVEVVAGAIVGFAKSLPGKVRAGLSALVGNITGVIRVAWAAGRAAFSAGVNAVASLARSIPGRIRSAVGNLGGILVAAGKAVIQGLINGIMSKLGPLGSALSKVGSFIARNKGPLPKDRKLLVPAGEAIMEGLINGMTSKLPALRVTLQGVTSDIQGIGANLGFANGADFGSGRLAGGGITQIINPRETQSEYEIARQANNRLLWAMSTA